MIKGWKRWNSRGFIIYVVICVYSFVSGTAGTMVSIPTGLSPAHTKVYQKLVQCSTQRHERGQDARPVVVFTDVGKDYDDMGALIVLKEFHRLKLIQLRAVVANLMPADKRARLARAALDSLGLREAKIPVAQGTRASPDEIEELSYEFNGSNMLPEPEYAGTQQDGQDLLRKVYQEAKERNEKLFLLCLSSLQDIHEFASNHPDLVAQCTAEVHMQGGNHLTDEGKLEPDHKAANNRFNWDAAKAWHSFIQTHAIPSHTYTKIVAYAAPLTSEDFVQLEATGHPIGAYLRRVQVEQDLAFYERACESDPAKRFAPFMDQMWFLANKTNYWHHHAKGDDILPMNNIGRSNETIGQTQGEVDRLPTGKEIIPYLTKIVLYDVHAALGIAGEDVVAELKLIQGKDRCINADKGGIKVDVVPHRICIDENSTLVLEQIQETVKALSALMRGSLLDSLQQARGDNSNVGADQGCLETLCQEARAHGAPPCARF